MTEDQTYKKKEKICFVFICQAGELEAKAVLLAVSLRYFLQNEHELVAAVPIPESRWGSLSKVTLEALGLLNVRTIKVRNEISDDYPIGNKLGCLAVETDCKKVVFVDSDVIMMRGFDESIAFKAPISAIPESGSVAVFEEWKYLYAKFGLPLPRQRILTELTKEESLPYVNAGFIATNTTPGLAAKWIECAKAINDDPNIRLKLKRPYLDQISFPIAAASLGLDIEYLSRDWNFPSWGARIRAERPPIFFHYQYAARLVREHLTAELVLSLCEQNPVYEAALSQHRSFKLALSRIPYAAKKGIFYINQIDRALHRTLTKDGREVLLYRLNAIIRKPLGK
jgi:hypothetical protein